MNTRQQETYERMLKVARRDALEVVGHGTRKSDGAAIYAVPSRTESNRWHLVRVHDATLQCDCVAAQYGRYCAHRAAVRARLELESQVRQDAREREVERAFHAAAAELDMTIDTHVAALGPKPRDDQRVFSLYK
jgi:hypothetical protein